MSNKVEGIEHGTLGRFNPNGRAYRGKATAFKTISGKSVILITGDIATMNEAASAVQLGRKVELDPNLCYDVVLAHNDDIQISFEQASEDDEL